MKTIKSWSFSRLSTFESCAYRARLQWLDKIPDNQPKLAADRGTAIHQEAEDYVTGKSPITRNLEKFFDDLSSLAEHSTAGRVICEEEWAFDRHWNSTDWAAGRGPRTPDCHGRVFIKVAAARQEDPRA